MHATAAPLTHTHTHLTTSCALDHTDCVVCLFLYKVFTSYTSSSFVLHFPKAEVCVKPIAGLQFTLKVPQFFELVTVRSVMLLHTVHSVNQ